MKKLTILALWALAFVLIAAPIYMNQDFHNVLVNGKPFSRAALVNGQWAVPLEDFSRAIGGNGVTLEPTLKLNGNQLTTSIEGESADHKQKDMLHSSSIIAVRKAGGISNNVFSANGQKWVPLADIARALGGTFTAPPGTLRPTESLSLNFTSNSNAVLGYQTGGHQ